MKRLHGYAMKARQKSSKLPYILRHRKAGRPCVLPCSRWFLLKRTVGTNLFLEDTLKNQGALWKLCKNSDLVAVAEFMPSLFLCVYLGNNFGDITSFKLPFYIFLLCF